MLTKELKMDLWHKITQWVDYNRYAVLALVLALVTGCGLAMQTPRTESVLTPPAKITTQQLDREVIAIQLQFDKQQIAISQLIASYNADVEATNAKLTSAEADLQQQYARRAKIVEALGGIATIATGTLTPASALGSIISLISLFGLVGVEADNIRKDRIIKAKTVV